MTLHHALHPLLEVDRLYVNRSEGSGGWISAKDSVNGISWYFESCKAALLKTVYKQEVQRHYLASH